MFGSLQLAPTNYYNVPTSIGNVETRLLLLHIGGHIRHPLLTQNTKGYKFLYEKIKSQWELRKLGYVAHYQLRFCTFQRYVYVILHLLLQFN